MRVLSVSSIIAAATLSLFALGQPAHAAGPTFAIDAGTDGNNSTSVGRIENCVAVKTGDRFQMDIVVQNITNLLAWEIPIDYDPEVVTVVGQDVKMFQQANAGSSVLDLSDKLPDDSGFHALKAFDSADPASPDSGSGVLARITFEAVGAGDSPIRFGNRDYDSNGMPDRASFLRKYVEGNLQNPGEDIIGDSNDDTFFDGEQVDAQVVVDRECPDGTVVAEASTVSEPSNNDGGSATPWAIIGGGAAAGVVALLGLAFLLTRRRGSRRGCAADI
ncbi:MAG: cohesin domain-containing protein [Chloroflexota bacterium]